jgi:ABC-type Na+ transport system ATPase subunit NatA
MIELKGVTKRYGAVEAIRDISFTAPRGRLSACSARTARARPRL